MCDGIYVQPLGPEGHGFCIPIYREKIHWPPPPPERFERLIEDIRVIATIHDAIGRVANDEARDFLSKAAHGALGAVARHLPEGVTIGDGLMRTGAAR